LPEEQHEHGADLTSMSRVLVIDGDLAVNTAVETTLELYGYDVTVAEDSRSGLAAAEQSRFDLIIVDIFMPGMDGLASIRRLKELAPSVPVVALSGFCFRNSAGPAPDFLAMAAKLGAAGSLQKPFAARELLNIVSASLTGGTPEPLLIPLPKTPDATGANTLLGDIEVPANIASSEPRAPGHPARPQNIVPMPPLTLSEPTSVPAESVPAEVASLPALPIQSPDAAAPASPSPASEPAGPPN
jgi:CheY-like chemotaxis protein